MVGTSGCVGSVNEACIKIMPVVTQGNTMINEAQDALLQAEVAVSLIKDETTRGEAMKAVAKARSALRVAESMLQSASEACTQPDLKGIFKVFADAWAVLRPFLSTLGGTGASEVKDPMAYELGK
jgi:hypothetical protein